MTASVETIRGRLAAVVALALVSCKTPRQPDGAPDAPGASVATHATIPSAGNVAPLRESDAAAPSVAPVDLLRYGPARIDVSSNVDNPRDFPEHLVDGNPRTAWNGRTGDLVGARISFAVPKGARIQSLSITAGFDKITAKGEDLFLMNHRIKKLTVLDGGKVVAEWRLDPQKREAQVLPLTLPGGIYDLRIDDVEPGTKKEWRELVVSELSVMGIPAGAPFSHPSIPNVTVNRPFSPLSDPLAESVRHPLPYGQLFADEATLCRRFDEAIAPAFAEPGGFVPEKPWCLFGSRLSSGAAQLTEVRKIDVADENGSTQAIALHTAAGWSVPETGVFSSSPCPRGCMDDMVQVSVTIESVKVDAGTATISVKQVGTATDGPPPPWVTTEWYTLRCPIGEPTLRCSRTTTKLACTPAGRGCP